MARTLRTMTRRSRPRIGDGWVQPQWMACSPAGTSANEAHRRWTVVGNVDSSRGARVDPRGLVCVDGRPWSLDWWIGAEDRWHVPAREAAVRQGLLGSTPVVETRLRVPGGDAVQRVLAVRGADGSDALVIEIENATSVPFAVALSVRPYDLHGTGGVREVSVDGAAVHADGHLVALLPAAPRHAVASTAADGDAAVLAFAGMAGAPPAASTCRDGLATLTVLHPLAHTATLRVVVPLGDARPGTSALPDASTVASGWRAHAAAGARVEVPDRRLQAAMDSSVSHLLLRHAGVPAAAAVDRFGFHALAARTLLDDETARRQAPGAALAAVVEHWSATRDPGTARGLATTVAALVTALARTSVSDRELGRARLAVAAELLDAAGETQAAADVRATRAAAVGSTPAVDQPLAVIDAAVLEAGGLSPEATLRQARADLASGAGPAAMSRLGWALGAASPTWTWPTTIPVDDPRGGEGDGHDVTVNAALLQLVHDLLVGDGDDGLRIAPHVPDAWLGQGWEVHDLPTTHGRLSFAVRWHGERPALLWELDAPAGAPAVRLTAPGLDPGWSSAAPRGESLLDPVAMPARRPRRGLSIPVSIEPPRSRP